MLDLIDNYQKNDSSVCYDSLIKKLEGRLCFSSVTLFLTSMFESKFSYKTIRNSETTEGS